MEFEWDERKHELNIQKHGVSFLSAARVFDGPVTGKITEKYGTFLLARLKILNSTLYTPFETEAFESFPHGEPIEMSEENIVRYSRDDLPEDSKTDWNRVAVLTEAELNAAARSEPDAQPFMSAEDWEKTEILAQIPIDRETFEYCTKHGGGFQTVIKNAVREYMDTHPIELTIRRKKRGPSAGYRAEEPIKQGAKAGGFCTLFFHCRIA